MVRSHPVPSAWRCDHGAVGTGGIGAAGHLAGGLARDPLVGPRCRYHHFGRRRHLTLVEALPYTVAAAVAAVLAGWIVFRGAFRYWRTPFARAVEGRGRWPWRLTVAAAASLATLAVLPVTTNSVAAVEHGLLLTLIAGLTWLGLAVLRAVEEAALERHDVSVTDNLHARRSRTRYLVLRRAGSALVVLVGLAAALLTFRTARTVGASLLASAGLLGVVLGVGAQSALKNLAAGIQIAFAEPIRLDDAVVVEGEWGWIEDITLTTVIVRVWDERRLVYPTAWFTENSFQNWTRRESQLLGEVLLVLDHRADVAALRAAAAAIVADSPHWDGRFTNCQVVGADVEGIHVRVLMTAVDGPTAWELRCEVREALVAWLVEHDPDALPVRRILPEAEGAGSSGGIGAGSDGE